MGIGMYEKFILDASCGGRMFWYNKNHPNAIYIDKRRVEVGHIEQRNCQHNIDPDIIMDFRDLKFSDNSFELVVWDSPHMVKLSETSILGKKYGCLNAETWQSDLKKGFSECWRVLKDHGILIFKWSEREIKITKVLSLFPVEPLFGHPIQSKIKTHWLCFMKIPEGE